MTHHTHTDTFGIQRHTQTDTDVNFIFGIPQTYTCTDTQICIHIDTHMDRDIDTQIQIHKDTCMFVDIHKHTH